MHVDPILKTREEIGYMREAGRILRSCHEHIEQWLTPGITTGEIDRRVEAFLAERGATPEQKGYKGYPYATCASVNEVVCHGFPDERELAAGDVVTIDMVVNKDGWLADSAWTYGIGEQRRSIRKLMRRTERALHRAIAQAVPGNTLGISATPLNELRDCTAMALLSRSSVMGLVSIFMNHPTYCLMVNAGPA